MFHLYNLLAQLTDEQRGEQMGKGVTTVLAIVIGIIALGIRAAKRLDHPSDTEDDQGERT
jgi:hypothetical protein